MDMTMARSARSRGHGGLKWWLVAGALAVGAAAGASWLLRPQVSIVEGRSALALLRLGEGDRLVTVAAATPHGAIRLTTRGDRLWPATPVPANTPVTVRAVVSGPVWNPFGMASSTRAVIVTPKDPDPVASTLSIAVGSPMSLGLSQASWGLLVRLAGSTWRHLTGDRARWTLNQSPTGPGQHGVVVVRTRARSWEQLSRPYTVAWETAPWLKVSAVTPSTIQAGQPLVIRFSQPVARLPLADLSWSPDLSGVWTRLGPATFQFQPSSSLTWWPDEAVTLTVAGGRGGVVATGGTYLATAETLTWQLPTPSVLRLQEVLADLGYLPLTFHSQSGPVPLTAGAQLAAAERPPQGSFSWRYRNIPQSLAAVWVPGQMTAMVSGAVMTFEAQNNLPIDGVAGSTVWELLMQALMAHKTDPAPYDYVYVSETLPERLTIWQNGRDVFTSLANTGIPQSPTDPGTYPVYLRYVSQTMTGINPDGVPYDDPGVPWVNYFNGGDAVHGFVRASYGFPQSLGCVELPPANAAIAWKYIQYGTLVTVEPPGSSDTPLPVRATMVAPGSGSATP